MKEESTITKFAGGLRRQLSDDTLKNIFNQPNDADSYLIAGKVNGNRFERYGDRIQTDEDLAQGNVSANRVTIVKNPAPFQLAETIPDPQNEVHERARKYSGLLRNWIDKRSMQVGATIDQVTQEAQAIALTNGIKPPTENQVRIVIKNAAEEFEKQAAMRKQQVYRPTSRATLCTYYIQ